MSTITTPSPLADQPAAELRAADREQAALTRLTVAVSTMWTWRQLAPPPARHATQAGGVEP